MGRQATLKKSTRLTDRNGVLQAFDEHTYSALDHKTVREHQDWKKVMAIALYFYTHATIEMVAKYLGVSERSIYLWAHEYYDMEGPVEAAPAWVQLAVAFTHYLDDFVES
mgnify:CR=1 FL=1|tara:strand:+ start:29660 stop:29989 length:330 start_codon:yes stop_codon:yes gene_type:complete